MTVVWIVEKVKEPRLSAASMLMGDYAVRVFASLSSLTTLARIRRRSRPDVLVVDLDDAGSTLGDVAVQLGEHFVDTPMVVIQSQAQTPEDPGDWVRARAFFYQKPVDGLALSMLLGIVATSHPDQRNVLRFREVVLDFERLRCLIVPGSEALSLPLKEAQILRLFLEKPGVCLSREEIQDALWPGIKVTSRTIDSHISRLRKRLKAATFSIESVYGGGYVLR